METTELKALINLLNDPDKSVYKAVKTRLLDLGSNVLPQLRKAHNSSTDSVFIKQSSDVISQVEFDDTFNLFKQWLHNSESNLLEGSFLIAKYVYPEIEYVQLMSEIELITKNSWFNFNDNLTPLERIKTLNHVIYNLHNYRGHTGDLYDCDNSCLNKVIENKQGGPVSLAILYIIVARRLGMSVYGVNLPRNFLVAYVNKSGNYDKTGELNDYEVSFYINPHQNGAVLTKREIEAFLNQQRIQSIPAFFSPCDDNTAIQRLLLNLFLACRKKKDKKKIKEIKMFLKQFKNQLPDYNL